jgi:hypothetical protein
LGLHAQAPGSVSTRALPLSGISAIDAHQNVYIAGGGGCAGIFATNCTPMNIVKVKAAGAVLFNCQDNSKRRRPPESDRGLGGRSIYRRQLTGVRRVCSELGADGSRFLYYTQLAASLLAPEAVRVDVQGNACIAGMTADFQPFVTKLSPNGSTFRYTVKLS